MARAPLALRPAATTAEYTLPYARAASASKGRGSKAASARWSRSWRRARSSGSGVACGPAASSAIVIALTATSTGSREGSMCSRSMTTEVSRSPRAGRLSGIGYDVLASPRIDVGTEAARVDGGRIPEDGNDGRRRHEPVAPQGSELAYRHSVASDDEGLPLVEPAHDLAAVVAELALGNGFSHVSTVAHRATVVDGSGKAESRPPKRAASA